MIWNIPRSQSRHWVFKKNALQGVKTSRDESKSWSFAVEAQGLIMTLRDWSPCDRALDGTV